MIWVIPIFVLALLGSGLALAYVIGAGAVLTFVLTDNTRYLAVLPQQVFSQISVFALMAMPLFILAGELMNRGGVTRALIYLSMALVGRLRGGLGHVNIMTSVFFAGISGSAVADSAALSNTLVPEMQRHGYSLGYAGAITAASSIIGPIVPPSIILIFYGAVMQTSVAALFAAGILPGLLLAAGLFAYNAFAAWREDHPRMERGETPPAGQALRAAAPALLLPLIILGGIVFGFATPTEAAAVAVLAAFGIGYLYSGFAPGDLTASLQRTAVLSGSIFILICAGAAFGHIAALERVPQAISTFMTDLGLGPLGYLFLLNVFFIIFGMVLDIPVAIAIVVPLLAPIALDQGVDPIHLGIVLCFNLCIGLITPPLGGCLLIVSTVTGENYWVLVWKILPFVVVEIVILAILVLIPEVSLALPRALGLWT